MTQKICYICSSTFISHQDTDDEDKCPDCWDSIFEALADFEEQLELGEEEEDVDDCTESFDDRKDYDSFGRIRSRESPTG